MTKTQTKEEVFNFMNRLGLIIAITGVLVMVPGAYLTLHVAFFGVADPAVTGALIFGSYLGGGATLAVGLALKGIAWVTRFGWH
ncbi:hypothetical protein KJ819_01205 [Patescibacteria group bacterium]|nr:hypothetical protein [Patescibacteria group bacterium]MBU1500560.1 hypothetical protein [Patescibacteria group bacterium]MBU2080471.1 hypothetical protein [Patescibacteria group bacterium]MBU2123724.1 hypothetical protein [Patescibacteria group bacterium]MBU2194580.1 hypothetical protein [Patescibacteria group bacterium]